MSDDTREKAVEAVSKVLYEYGWQGTRTWERDAGNREGYRAKARATLDAAGWSPSPVPMVDREALKAELRSIYGANLSEMNDWDEDADAILASNILRPLPSEEEIAEVLYDCWNFGSSEVPWMGTDARRELARAVLALLRGEKR